MGVYTQKESMREEEKEMAQPVDLTRKCNKVGGIAAAMEDERRGVQAMARAMEEVTRSFKKRKVASNVDDDQHLDQPRLNSPEESVLPASSEFSDRVTASQCSSNESTGLCQDGLRSADLKIDSQPEGFETAISASINLKFSRETTPTSDLCADTDVVESSTAMKPSTASLGLKNLPAMMPSATEIDEFFSAAEKHQQKLFADKYNYDIAKDVPLEGRYEWVALKP